MFLIVDTPEQASVISRGGGGSRLTLQSSIDFFTGEWFPAGSALLPIFSLPVSLSSDPISKERVFIRETPLLNPAKQIWGRRGVKSGGANLFIINLNS